MTRGDTGDVVLVGVDGSDDALRAVRWGAAEARRRRLPLRLVHAFAWVKDADFGASGATDQYRDVLLEHGHRNLEAAAAVARGVAPELAVQQQLTIGYPVDVLGTEARRAAVAVLGDRGLSRIEGLLVGSTAMAMAAHAACPIVVVRGAETDPGRSASLPVVVGVDDSGTSEAAIEFALEAAAARGAPVVAVHACGETIIDTTFGRTLHWDVIESDVERELDHRLAGWSAKYSGVEIQRVVYRDRPARRLVEMSEDAQLVVVGSRGRGEFAGLVLGSVGNALVHRAGCPVAIVRPLRRPR